MWNAEHSTYAIESFPSNETTDSLGKLYTMEFTLLFWGPLKCNVMSLGIPFLYIGCHFYALLPEKIHMPLTSLALFPFVISDWFRLTGSPA